MTFHRILRYLSGVILVSVTLLIKLRKMIDNSSHLRDILYFDMGSYHVQIVQRSKDGHDKANVLIAEWYIHSEERFNLLLPAFRTLCKEYNARCYIGVNPKSDTSVLWELAGKSLERLKTGNIGILPGVLSSAHDSTTGALDRWIIDWDDKTIPPSVFDEINDARSATPGENVVKLITTVNGFHIITRPFDSREFKEKYPVDIKKNNMTLLMG